LGSPYLGAIVKGNGEGVRLMPPEANQGLFTGLHSLGAGLAANGRLDPETLGRLAHPERFPAILGPVFQFIFAPAVFPHLFRRYVEKERRLRTAIRPAIFIAG
jgi:hypothetical protein